MWSAMRRSALLLALVVGLAGCANEVRRTGLPIEDDFSGGCDWAQDDTEDVSLSCESGEYRVLLKRTDRTPFHVIPRRVDQPVDSATVEADAKLVTFGGDENDFEGDGVTCWASRPNDPTQGYAFVVRPGAYAILREDEKDQRLSGQLYFRAFKDSNSDAVAGLGKVNRLRGQCRARGGRVELAMWVNGRRLATATDRAGFESFNGFGFVVLGSVPGTQVSFDNFRAAELGTGN
jgi:hypothetical protein